jgi:benzoate/toluate 1,2-dioxygenase alpha subunit
MQRAQIEGLVDDRPQEGVFRVHRDAFTSQAVFDLEMRHIFEGTWIFLGMESQAARPHDYFTTRVGRQPVVVMRDAEGRLGAFYNACRHRRAAICPLERGNAKVHVCRYHGWTYDSAGRNVGIKALEQGRYPEGFASQDHGLLPLARFENYRGFLFGSASAAVPTLAEHLGDMRTFLDLIADQSPQGISCVPGSVGYRYDGNWKFQIENGVDAYHFSSTHPTYIGILAKRKAEGEGGGSVYEGFRDADLFRGGFTFPNGHNALYGSNPAAGARALAQGYDALVERLGDTRAKWLLYTRNITIFPNIQIAENASLQLRVLFPLAPDRTEVRTYCLVPRGESGEQLRTRIRQYEEFFNPSGLATPDDTVNYEDCQTGYNTGEPWQQGYLRGLGALQAGANKDAEELGVHPLSSTVGPFELGDETLFHACWREWRRLLLAGQD